MNGPLDADNLEREVLAHGQVSIEPGYLGFLRSQGYTIDSLKEAHAVKRPNSERAHLVLKVVTFDKPDDDPNLDYVADKIDLYCCDCWRFRTESADVREGEPPSECGTCPHIKQVAKSEKAKADENQTTLEP